MRVEIRPITQAVAKSFIERWHYSKRVPTGKNIFFGAFIGTMLYAVVNYGIGVNPYQAKYLARTTNLSVRNKNLVELKRLCRIEPLIKEVPLTKVLAICHRLLRRRSHR